jgi:hypothetical protein
MVKSFMIITSMNLWHWCGVRGRFGLRDAPNGVLREVLLGKTLSCWLIGV